MESGSRRTLTSRFKIHEVLQMLEDDDEENEQPCDIVFHIPLVEENGLTDEDSANSDDDIGNMNHLGPGLLNTTCDYVPHNVNEDSTDEESNDTPVVASSKASKRQKLSNDTWTKTCPIFDINTNSPQVQALPDIVLAADNELELFKLFFDNDFVQNIISQSNMYAQQKNITLNVSEKEMWVMFGGFLLSGYAKYPNKRLYWSRSSDAPNILSDAIRCNRFEEILHNMHFNDNSKIDASDRLYKIRPVLDHLGEKFLQLNVLEEHISIDESMIPYYGRHFAKQYIKGKPIRFGYKNWALCASTGYMYAFDIYMGKTTNPSISIQGLGVGGQTILHLIEKAKIPHKLGHKIYFDNYFTSYTLLNHLSHIGVCATGTARENRLGNCPLPKKAAFQKQPKGAIEGVATSSIFVVKYKDNNVVTMASNFDSFENGTKSRYSSEKRGYIQVPQPVIVKHYNTFMGGVDQIDQWVANYRTRMRQEKWWWPIFIYFFDVTTVNAWLLWKKAKKDKVPLLQFRQKLAISILKSYGTASSQGKRAAVVQDSVRYDGMNHWLRASNLRRCGFCTGKAKFSCVKCDVGLHPKCHEGYHV